MQYNHYIKFAPFARPAPCRLTLIHIARRSALDSERVEAKRKT